MNRRGCIAMCSFIPSAYTCNCLPGASSRVCQNLNIFFACLRVFALAWGTACVCVYETMCLALECVPVTSCWYILLATFFPFQLLSFYSSISLSSLLSLFPWPCFSLCGHGLYLFFFFTFRFSIGFDAEHNTIKLQLKTNFVLLSYVTKMSQSVGFGLTCYCSCFCCLKSTACRSHTPLPSLFSGS